MSDSSRMNSLGQPIGPSVSDWLAPPLPSREVTEGTWCRLEPLDPDLHGEQLFHAFRDDREGRNWTYLGYGPFESLQGFRQWMERDCSGSDPLFFAIRDRHGSGQAVGMASYLRIDPPAGAIEVGHISYSNLLQRTTAATEAMFLMMRRAFELGYRRYEWKCDALNEGSRRAALRLGFRYEGTFRQARVYKGRNRDTAWFSVIDSEWPEVRSRFERWLSPDNFDSAGNQLVALDADFVSA